ncbi:hypothetical protein [Haladaptatus halobius]|uniref:hypothetical protein n=1 Tax=Haladaptatus halobius TaxID=2884875 RepID=UPI001D0A61CC|nr:hypothetical protein [Haladaptatus halobius]
MSRLTEYGSGPVSGRDLELVEQRWNLKTVHEESNVKFGFKQYELEQKQAI